MNSVAARSIDNRYLIVDLLLQNIAEELDIPPGKYKEAVERYTAVGKWLDEATYVGTNGKPTIYVQGSFRLGTVIRPFRKGLDAEYDIDLACELRSSVSKLTAEEAKKLVGDRLKSNEMYRKMLEKEGRRCWTLVYAEKDGIGFHLDALPCVPHPISVENIESKYTFQAIGITNFDDPNNRYSWGYSNPNGFADWFADRQRRTFKRVEMVRKQELFARHPELFASVGEVPDSLVRTPLQRTVQILKRHRDVRFSGHELECDKPISVIITTLAALAYNQESDVCTTLAGFLDQLQRYNETGLIRSFNGDWIIENPTNPGENFADKWNEGNSRKSEAFFKWLDWVREDIDDLLNAASNSELERTLIRAFGKAPGQRVAGAYGGALPGAQQRPMSLFGRITGNLLRFDVPHKEAPRWHIRTSPFRATIKAKYRRNGFRPTAFQSNSSPLPKYLDLDFEVETSVPKPFDVYWQVVNTGSEALKAHQLRGDFYDGRSSGRTRTESTKYKGMHWVEGFVVKDGVCVARTGEFVVNVA